MTRWWISWESAEVDYRPIEDPPPLPILGWWCSGSGESTSTICAVVQAETEDEAKAHIAKAWPETYGGEWRFCDDKGPDFVPGERFVKRPWQALRLSRKKPAPATGEV